MPNAANIDRLINWLQGTHARTFKMGSWNKYINNPDDRAVERYEPCNTAFCLGGWIDFITQIDAGIGYADVDLDAERYGFDIIENGADFLGISRWQACSLFASQDSFDNLPDEVRLEAAVNVLTALKETGTVNWLAARDKARAWSSYTLESRGLR